MMKIGKSCPEECSVSGALGIVFQISQLVGIGPLTFKKTGHDWSVRLSPTLCWVSYITATVMNTAAVAGLVFDLQAMPSQSTRVRSPTRRFVWITDYVIVMLTASVGLYGAPKRLKQTILCLSKIQKIKDTGYIKSSSEWKANALILTIFAFLLIILATDYYIYMNEVILHNREFRAACLYSCYYYGYLLLFLLELQFVVSALEVSKALVVIHNSLSGLSHLLSTPYLSLDNLMMNSQTKIAPKKSLNLTIDSMATINVSTGFIVPSRSTSETIRHLASMYNEVFNVVKQMDSCHGPGALLLLLSFLLHLVITPYNFMLHVSSYKGLDLAAGIQVLWCALHFSCTLLIAEPGHSTHIEVERITTLVSCMIIKCNDTQICKELKNFSTYFSLNKFSYNPLGVCSLTRSLVASIIGSVVTYLVIIIQFQLSEQ